ncbi:MAG TPA: Lsr2 family protein [Streptosporangiaceae bacterium]|nr:Lsr2 family protein [Streptosporangiaceae bacterium]
MAQKIMTSFVDDIDGSEAEGTVRFALDGDEFEIDLNAKHSAALRKVLGPYVAAGRKGSVSRRPARRVRRGTSGGANTTEVREWARSQGIDVKGRGRIPAELMVKFQAAAGG